MKIQDLVKFKLPSEPGVYFFKLGKDILYIGKATSLKDRVRSYFANDLINTRGPSIVDMVFKSDQIKFEKTDSVLEALILEAELIKKHQPYYNVKEKDDKSWNYVCITKDKLPLVLVVRGKNLKHSENFSSLTLKGSDALRNFQNVSDFSSIYGPFTNSMQLREAMKIIRRIFPFFDLDSIKKQNQNFYEQIGLAPRVIPANAGNQVSVHKTNSLDPGSSFADSLSGTTQHTQEQGIKEYQKNIKNLKLFFEGKKKKIVKNLEKEMKALAKAQEFEKADLIKHQLFALTHINDIALLKRSIEQKNEKDIFRIEAYDIAHMSGKNMVGVMTVVENGEVNKNEYRKFIIKTVLGANDPAALKEMVMRRLKHAEWRTPHVILVDGNDIQKNVVEKILKEQKIKIPVIALVKNEKHKPKALIGDETIIKKYKDALVLANAEAHRFAIGFHKQKRNKSFLQ